MDETVITKTIDSALMHGMDADLSISRNNTFGTLVLVQPPVEVAHTALYPDLLNDCPDEWYYILEKLLGTDNCETTADGVMNALRDIENCGFTITNL